MPLILLKYSELTTIDGAALVAASWNLVPVNKIVRDDNKNCVINANTSFTISNKIYPKIVRFNIHSSIVNTTGTALIAKSRLLLLKEGGVTQVVDTSLNFKLITNQSQGLIKQISSMLLDRPSTFRLEVWSNVAALFGKAASDGSEERYANLEITVE